MKRSFGLAIHEELLLPTNGCQVSTQQSLHAELAMQNADTVLPISLRRASADALRERNFKGEHFSPVSPACGRNLCLRTPVKTQAWREVCKNQRLLSRARRTKRGQLGRMLCLECPGNLRWAAILN